MKELIGYAIPTQLRDLSEVVQHFYPENDLPTNKEEYRDKVRNFADIVEEPWFNREAGLPSITALIKKIPVGDRVVLSRENDYDDPWRGGWENVVTNAIAKSCQVPLPPISAKVMEQMSGSDNNV
jgi:hypothetical protein